MTGVDDVKKQLEQYGIPLVAEWFNPGDSDFTGQLTKLINAKIEVLVALGVDADQGPIVKQARLNGFDGLIVGPESLSVPSVKGRGGKGRGRSRFRIVLRYSAETRASHQQVAPGLLQGLRG